MWILRHCQTLWNLTPSEEKRSGETTNQNSYWHDYSLFPSRARTCTTPLPKPEPQCLFNFSTHPCAAWKHGTRHKTTFQLCQSLVNGFYTVRQWLKLQLRLVLHGAICLADSFEVTIYHCTGLTTFRHEWATLNRIAADKSHSVIVFLFTQRILD